MPVAPSIEEQRMASLARGNTLRTRRKHLKEELGEDEVRLADVLLNEAEWLRGMRVREILLAAPGIGKHKADRALRATLLSSTTRLGKVSLPTRERLLAFVESRAQAVQVRSDPAKQIADLTERVEGLETLVATLVEKDRTLGVPTPDAAQRVAEERYTLPPRREASA